MHPAPATASRAPSGSRRSAVTPMSQSPSPSVAVDFAGIDVDGDDRCAPPASRAAASASLPACPAPSDADRAAPGHQRRGSGMRPRRRRRSRARRRQRQIVGNASPGGALEDVRGARDLDLGRVRDRRSRDRVEAQRRKRQRAERDDCAPRSRAETREALPDGRHRAEQHAAGVGRRVVHLAARVDDLHDPAGHPCRIAVRTLAYLAVGGRVEAQPLDGDLDLVGPNGSGRHRGAPPAEGDPRRGRGLGPRRAVCLMTLAENFVFMNDR